MALEAGERGLAPGGGQHVQTIISPEKMSDLAGQEQEASSWLQITQERVNRFAAATGDHQFIHVDPEKAALTPLGGTIAHGFLLLSLLPHLLSEQAWLPEGLAMSINYGSDKVRFLNPVPVGSFVRARQKVISVEEKKPGMWLVKSAAKLEIRGEEKPALIAELITLFSVG